jgi:hypothetical protein
MRGAAGLRRANGSTADIARNERRERPEEREQEQPEFVMAECYAETGRISFRFGKVRGNGMRKSIEFG